MGEWGYNLKMGEKRDIYYKGMRVGFLGLPKSGASQKTQKKNTIKKRLYHPSFVCTFKKDSPKNLVVMYDIPHAKKKERDWFRRHLRKFGYLMIQRSVWVGPSPLPKEFLDYLNEIKIGNNLKTLKLAKPYKGKL
jgi:DNA-binding transcriptional regulator PaaX